MCIDDCEVGEVPSDGWPGLISANIWPTLATKIQNAWRWQQIRVRNRIESPGKYHKGVQAAVAAITFELSTSRSIYPHYNAHKYKLNSCEWPLWIYMYGYILAPGPSPRLSIFPSVSPYVRVSAGPLHKYQCCLGENGENGDQWACHVAKAKAKVSMSFEWVTCGVVWPDSRSQPWP